MREIKTREERKMGRGTRVLDGKGRRKGNVGNIDQKRRKEGKMKKSYSRERKKEGKCRKSRPEKKERREDEEEP